MKRCPKCKFKRGLPSRTTSKTELLVTRLFMTRHYRCMRCGIRFLGFWLYIGSRKPKSKQETATAAPILARNQMQSGD